MKKIVILLLITAIHVSALGQTSTITPKFGLTVSNMEEYYNKYKTGYLFGASAEFKLSKKISLKPELLLEQKGGSSRVIYTDENGWPMAPVDLFITFNNITVPVLLKISPFNNNKIYFTAGEYAGYMLWARERLNSTDGKFNNSKIAIENNYCTRWEVGFSLGSGIGIPLGNKGGFQVDVRYEYAFAHFDPKLLTTVNTFALSFGYRLGSGK